jgi:hypothetical protein
MEQSEAFGPEYSKIRETVSQARRPARPTRPTAGLTAERGLGSATTSLAIFTSAFMAPSDKREW